MVGKRGTISHQDCFECCSADLCNRHCNGTATSALTGTTKSTGCKYTIYTKPTEFKYTNYTRPARYKYAICTTFSGCKFTYCTKHAVCKYIEDIQMFGMTITFILTFFSLHEMK